ncbi:hypothetical protein PFISCL1PPCAC_8859, partial [Pristionchus fissidentatus]
PIDSAMDTVCNAACDLASLLSYPFVGEATPSDDANTSSGEAEETFEIVDAASSEEDEEDSDTIGEATGNSADNDAAEKTDDEGKEEEGAVEKALLIPAPRFIRVEMRDDEEDCGMGWFSYQENGVNEIYVRSIIKDSAADRAGLAVSDRIHFVNGVYLGELSNAEIFDLFAAATAEKSFEVLVLEDIGQLYELLNIRVSLDLPNIVRGADADAANAPVMVQLVLQPGNIYGFT